MAESLRSSQSFELPSAGSSESFHAETFPAVVQAPSVDVRQPIAVSSAPVVHKETIGLVKHEPHSCAPVATDPKQTLPLHTPANRTEDLFSPPSYVYDVEEFLDIRNHHFLRVSAIVPKIEIGNPSKNALRHLKLMQTVYNKGAQLIVCPELGLTGASAGDCLYMNSLIDASIEALRTLLEATKVVHVLKSMKLEVWFGEVALQQSFVPLHKQ